MSKMNVKTRKALIIVGSIVGGIALLFGALLLALVLSLKGYTPFTEGTYASNVAEDGSYAQITVTAIDKQSYEAANGVNVVKDAAKRPHNRYYQLDVVTFDADGNRTQVNFVNLQKDVHEDPHASRYVDDNDNSICVFKELMLFVGDANYILSL